MEGLGNILFLLIMIAFFAIGDLLQKVRKRTSGTPEPSAISDRERVAAETAPAEVQPLRVNPRLTSRNERRPAPRRLERSVSAPIPVRHMLAGRENLRRAFIAMTVLGTPASERSRSEPREVLDGERPA